MVKSKKSNKRIPKKAHVKNDIQIQEDLSPIKTNPYPSRSRVKIVLLVLAVIIGAVLLARKFNNQKLAAKVNGLAITRKELETELVRRYGSPTLESLIGEKLLFAEADKQKVEVTDSEIGSKQAEVEKVLGGKDRLKQELETQGIDEAELKRQIKTQLVLEKLFSAEATVSGTEIETYLKINSQYLTASGEADKKIQAETQIRNSKIYEKFREWIEKVKQAAKIERFL